MTIHQQSNDDQKDGTTTKSNSIVKSPIIPVPSSSPRRHNNNNTSTTSKYGHIRTLWALLTGTALLLRLSLVILLALSNLESGGGGGSIVVGDIPSSSSQSPPFSFESIFGLSSPDSGASYWKELVYLQQQQQQQQERGCSSSQRCKSDISEEEGGVVGKGGGGDGSPDLYYLRTLSPAFVEVAGWIGGHHTIVNHSQKWKSSLEDEDGGFFFFLLNWLLDRLPTEMTAFISSLGPRGDSRSVGGASNRFIILYLWREIKERLPFILVDAVLNTSLLSLIGFILVPLFQWRREIKTTTTATSGPDGESSIHTTKVDGGDKGKKEIGQWICTKCTIPKPLSGAHLEGKVEIRSDCFTCGRKCTFQLIKQDGDDDGGLYDDRQQGGSAATHDEIGGVGIRAMMLVGDPSEYVQNENHCGDEDGVLRQHLRPQVIALLVLHVANPFQIMMSVSMSLRQLEQATFLIGVTALTIASNRIPTTSKGSCRSQYSIKAAGVVAGSLILCWLSSSCVSLLVTAMPGAEALRLSIYFAALTILFRVLHCSAVIQKNISKTRQHYLDTTSTTMERWAIVTVFIFLVGAVSCSLQSTGSEDWENNNPDSATAALFPLPPPPPPPTHNPPDAGVTWYLNLLLPSPVADLYPALLSLLPSIVSVMLLSALLPATLRLFLVVRGVRSNKELNITNQVEDDVDDSTLDNNQQRGNVSLISSSFERLQWWTLLPLSSSSTSSCSPTTTSNTNCGDNSVDDDDVKHNDDKNGNKAATLPLIEDDRSEFERQLPPWTPPSFPVRALFVTTYLFVVLTRSTFIRTDVTFAILLTFIVTPEVVLLSLIQPKYESMLLSSSSPSSIMQPRRHQQQPSYLTVMGLMIAFTLVIVSVPIQYTMHGSWLINQLANPNWLFFVGLAHVGGYALGTLMYVKALLYLLKITNEGQDQVIIRISKLE